MAHKQPPVPPDEKSPRPGSDKPSQPEKAAKADTVPENLREQGQQGNTYQNTHNQGYQQDR